MSVQEVFQVGLAVIGSLGGGGLIVLALSSWLGKIWARRLMGQERKAHEEALERLRVDLQDRSTHQTDVLFRKRDIYQQTVVAMRVFLEGSHEAVEEQKRAFLRSCDSCFLWASDAVLNTLGAFLDRMIENTRRPDPQNQPALQAAYADCLTAMRKDAGFSDTKMSRADYRVVTF